MIQNPQALFVPADFNNVEKKKISEVHHLLT